MSKVLKRLYLGDVVKSFGTKQLRKLTTEKPQEDGIIGTWRFRDTLTNPFSAPTNAYTENIFDFDIPNIELSSEKSWDSVRYGYWNGDTSITLSYRWETTDNTTGNIVVYENGVWIAPSGYTVDDVKTIVIESQPLSKTFITWLKANATKQESIVGTWTIKPDADYAALAPLLHTNNPNVIRCAGSFNAHSPLTGEAVSQPLARIYVEYSSYYDKYFLYLENTYAVENYGQAETAKIVFSIGTAERYYTEYDPQGNSGTLAQSLYEFEPTNETYMTFTIGKITETNDVEIDLPLLYNWLQANAIKQESIVGTWVFKDTVNLPNEVIDYNIFFTHVNGSFMCKRIRLGIYTMYCYTYGNSEITVYSSFNSPPFQSDTYKTIAITGGADINNPEFVAWLRANATKIA